MILIIGGGLSGSLLAYRLLQLQKPIEFKLVEFSEQLGGNHTWSFHDSDIEPASFSRIKPLIQKSWSHQEVKFFDRKKIYSASYHSITSSKLASEVQRALGSRVLYGRRAESIRRNGITLEGGVNLEAQIVFDARGSTHSSTALCGYQKFLGMDIELKEPHHLTHPVIMDACCEQKGGYRFFYLLPWSPTHLLIEDTRYTNTPEMNASEYKDEILKYCESKGWKIKKIYRTESAALPIPLAPHPKSSPHDLAIPIGLRGNYFHPTTGYSVPYAVRLSNIIADEIENNPSWNLKSISNQLDVHRKKIRSQSHFFALLNRFLFLAAEPENRWKIFSRFYGLNQNLIFRFYKGELLKRDQLNLLLGKPPVPLLKAVRYAIHYK